jgi:hypothetical protein
MKNKTLKLIYHRDPKDSFNYYIYLTNDSDMDFTEVLNESSDIFSDEGDSFASSVLKAQLGPLKSGESLLVEKTHESGLDFLTTYDLRLIGSGIEMSFKVHFKYNTGRNVKISGKNIIGELIGELNI